MSAVDGVPLPRLIFFLLMAVTLISPVRVLPEWTRRILPHIQRMKRWFTVY